MDDSVETYLQNSSVCTLNPTTANSKRIKFYPIPKFLHDLKFENISSVNGRIIREYDEKSVYKIIQIYFLKIQKQIYWKKLLIGIHNFQT